MAARLSADTLRVSRVGIWLFGPDHTTLRCEVLHGTWPTGTLPILEISASAFPTYMRALSERRWVSAPDAVNDPVTSELAAGYLVPQQIGALLDAPIFRGDELFGIVCHEHVGGPREWTPHDKAFAGTIADILALVFEQANTLQSERRRRELEAERRQAQKLEVLARLALSVAHDVNNVLTTIQLLVASYARDASPFGEVARDILAAVGTGARFTQDLLRLAQQQRESAAISTDVGSTALAFDGVLTAMVRGQATLDLQVSSDTLRARATASQIQQILLNLVVNARDAIGTGGTIRVNVRGARRADAAFVEISVSDTGGGMTDAVRRRLFEPFFTTKSSGTGWGLTIVREIVESLGGTIEVETRFGEGTTFIVWLPAAKEEEPADELAAP
jgi:two-component system, cell cycle sensor histidine kinase and response regulator CckA